MKASEGAEGGEEGDIVIGMFDIMLLPLLLCLVVSAVSLLDDRPRRFIMMWE